MTQEQKQAIWAAGWLIQNCYEVEPLGETHSQWQTSKDNGDYRDHSDAELIQYAKEKGMELPAELTGWQPIDQIPEEWKDGREVLLLPLGRFVRRKVLIWDKDSQCWLCPHSKLGWPDKTFTHAMLIPESQKETTE
jgi:hypothetical protein